MRKIYDAVHVVAISNKGKSILFSSSRYGEFISAEMKKIYFFVMITA